MPAAVRAAHGTSVIGARPSAVAAWPRTYHTIARQCLQPSCVACAGRKAVPAAGRAARQGESVGAMQISAAHLLHSFWLGFRVYTLNSVTVSAFPACAGNAAVPAAGRAARLGESVGAMQISAPHLLPSFRLGLRIYTLNPVMVSAFPTCAGHATLPAAGRAAPQGESVGAMQISAAHLLHSVQLGFRV